MVPAHLRSAWGGAMARLRITESDGTSRAFDTEQRLRLTIGRSHKSDIVLSEPALSRHHAELVREDRGWFLRDCDSRNGTFLNGRRLTAPAILSAGHVIGLGRSKVVFEPARGSEETAYLSEAEVTWDETRDLTPADARAVRPPAAWFGIVEDATRQLAAHLPSDVLYDKVAELVSRAVRAERVAVFSRGPDGELICEACRGSDSEMPVFHSIVRRVVEEQISVLMPDVQAQGEPHDSIVECGIRSVLAVPLRNQQEVIGFIYADSRKAACRFGDHELRLLTMLADIATIQIENADFVQKHMKTQHLECEARAAAEIQARLLPRHVPSIPGYEFEWRTIPCYEVGGDYCDCLTRGVNRYGLALADVAGHGIGAAMLMAVTLATLRSRVDVELDTLVGQMNSVIFSSAPENRFVTFFFGELDYETHTLRYVNAGHAPAPLLVRRSGAVERLSAWTIPLGLFDGIGCASRQSELKQGDLVFACTDGVTDTTDPDGDMYGDERLERLLAGLAGRPAAKVLRAVESELGAFARGTPQPDDLTMTILRRE